MTDPELPPSQSKSNKTTHPDLLDKSKGFIFKILVIGSSGVGKTSLIKKYGGSPMVSDSGSSIGVDFYNKTIQLFTNQQAMTGLQIWDMIGDARFRSVLPFYLNGTHGLIYAFSADNNKTLDELSGLIDTIHRILITPIPSILISTKNDLLEEPIKKEMIIPFLKQYAINNYLRTSSQTGENIEELFSLMLKLILKEEGFI